MSGRRRIVGLILLALILSACGSTADRSQLATTTSLSDDPSFEEVPDPSSANSRLPSDVAAEGNGRAATTGSPTADADSSRLPGPSEAISKNTSPIKLGFMYGSNRVGATQDALGIENGLTVSRPEDALISWFNKNGGLAGRRIVKVEHYSDNEANSFEANLQAGCEYFSTDEKVDAVIEAGLQWSDNFEQCLSRNGIVHVSSGTLAADQHAMASLRGFVNPSGMTVNDRLTSLINVLADQRYLTPDTLIGFILEDCPYNRRAWERSIEPALRARKLRFIRTEFTCATGNQDVPAAAAGLENAVLRFKTAGVTRVMMASNHEGVAWFLFSQPAQNQQYYPGYAMTSAGFAQVNIEENFPPEQAENVRGVGFMPSSDVGSTGDADAASQKLCLDILSKGGIKPQSPLDHAALYSGCEMFFVLDSILERTNGDSTASAVTQAVGRLGRSFRSPFALTGTTSLAPGRSVGARWVAPFAYKSSCECARFNGPPVSID